VGREKQGLEMKNQMIGKENPDNIMFKDYEYEQDLKLDPFFMDHGARREDFGLPEEETKEGWQGETNDGLMMTRAGAAEDSSDALYKDELLDKNALFSGTKTKTTRVEKLGDGEGEL